MIILFSVCKWCHIFHATWLLIILRWFPLSGGMWCLPLVWCCLLIILGCHATSRRYVMSSIGSDATYWSFLGCHFTLSVYVMSSIGCDICCLLIIFVYHSTLRKYVMSFIRCDAVCWSFWGVIQLLGGTWCLSLGVMLTDHFEVSFYSQRVCDVFYWV